MVRTPEEVIHHAASDAAILAVEHGYKIVYQVYQGLDGGWRINRGIGNHYSSGSFPLTAEEMGKHSRDVTVSPSGIQISRYPHLIDVNSAAVFTNDRSRLGLIEGAINIWPSEPGMPFFRMGIFPSLRIEDDQYSYPGSLASFTDHQLTVGRDGWRGVEICYDPDDKRIEVHSEGAERANNLRTMNRSDRSWLLEEESSLALKTVLEYAFDQEVWYHRLQNLGP